MTATAAARVPLLLYPAAGQCSLGSWDARLPGRSRVRGPEVQDGEGTPAPGPPPAHASPPPPAQEAIVLGQAQTHGALGGLRADRGQ